MNRRLGVMIAVLAATLVACSDDDENARGGIGAVCGSSAQCSDGLFCYSSSETPTNQLSGQCTVKCEYSSGAGDSCKKIDANTACVTGSICARECGNGLTCPTGTTCSSSSEFCVHFPR